jgi:hypothetical protein
VVVGVQSDVKAFRYGLLLPFIHLAVSLPVIYYEESLIWRQIPRIQAAEDFEKAAPPPISHSGPVIGWDPCYEYRASNADRLILLVEFPAGMLIPPHGACACNPTLLRPMLQELKRWVRLKTRIVLLDCLLTLGIVGQWWLVGRWIDRRREQHGPVKRWIIPVAVITTSGIIVALAYESRGSLEVVAIILSLIAILAWLSLLLMAGVVAAKWALWFTLKGRSGTSR